MEQEFKTYTMAIDMVRTIGQPPFEVVWGDTGNLLSVTLTNDGRAIDLTDKYVCVVFRSSIGTALQDNTNGLTLTPGATGAFSLKLLPESYGAGDVSADIQVYSGEDKETLITSRRFTFRCRNALLNDRTMQANGTYPPLIEATHRAENAAKALERLSVTAETLEPGQAAAAAVTDVNGRKMITLGIPKGEKGAQGGPGPAGPQGAPGEVSMAQLQTAIASVTPESIGAAAASHAASHAAGGADALTPAAIGAVPAVERGAANGVATLDTAGKVAAAQASAAIVEKTAAYTIALTDAGKLVTLTADTALTVTLPADSAAAFPIGTEIELAQLGAGAVTVAAAEGVTVHSLDGSVKLAGQYAAVCLKKIAAGTWLLGGALE